MGTTNFEVKGFFDPDTYTITFVVWDPATKDSVVIDPVLDYDPKASSTSTGSAAEVAQFVLENDLNLHYVLETHAHADHLSGSQLFKQKFGAKIVIGDNITKVQEAFKGIFHLPENFRTDGSQFDILLKEGETVKAGTLEFGIMYTPGHTPACGTFIIEDAIFTGDVLFMDDYGTGRCDFPGGSAEDMYDSLKKLYALPDETRVFVGHDYMPGGREPRWETTIGKSKANNPQMKGDTSKEDFVKFRTERDATLAAPRLLFQSVQVNIDAGNLPEAEANDIAYLKIPLNVFRGAEQAGVEDPFSVTLVEEEIQV